MPCFENIVRCFMCVLWLDAMSRPLIVLKMLHVCRCCRDETTVLHYQYADYLYTTFYREDCPWKCSDSLLHKTINLLCCEPLYNVVVYCLGSRIFTFNHLLRVLPVKTTDAAASSISSSMVFLSFGLQLNRYNKQSSSNPSRVPSFVLWWITLCEPNAL